MVITVEDVSKHQPSGTCAVSSPKELGLGAVQPLTFIAPSEAGGRMPSRLFLIVVAKAQRADWLPTVVQKLRESTRSGTQRLAAPRPPNGAAVDGAASATP
jgi:hypothetical protein